jgi:hexosaminidase
MMSPSLPAENIARRAVAVRLVRVCMLACGLVSALSAVGQAAPHLIPQPREAHLAGRVAIHTLTVSVPSGDPRDFFAACNLEDALSQQGVLVAPAAGPVDLVVTLLRQDSAASRQTLQHEHLAFDPAMDAEGYVLIARPGSVLVIGKTAAGIFYGVQTLKQLVERNDGAAALWTGTIRDWPAMKYRGVSDDVSRGPFPTLAFMKHQLEVFAAYKVNLYSPYFEHTLEYAADPLAAPPGSALTRSEAQELAAFAANLHIMVVPEQEAFGHLHHVLQYQKYADLAETPHGHVLAPGQPGSVPLIQSWFTQIAQDFPGPFLHVGADETFELGTGRTKADVDKRGLGLVYADFLTSIHTALAPLDRRLLFWGDVAWNDPAAVQNLPKDMIAIPWVYWHEDNYDGNITAFKKAGIETWVAPGDANWSVVYPNIPGALDNISGFVESGQRLGSTGELTAVWNDDGEGLFDEDWFGVLFGAAAAWQPGKSGSAPYQTSFGSDFYGDTTGTIDHALAEIIAAENLIDISDTTFWVDPWSPEGIATGAKLRKKIPNGRLHAERAIELIETALATNPNLRERNALNAMELGARRIDFIGMKFQLAEEMESAYAKAYAARDDDKHQSATRDLLDSISSMNGRCQDLRDAYSMLKHLYRESWLAENRPYWLDNVLVRYDLRIQLWQQRGEKLELLNQQWQDKKGMPSASEAGIPAAPAQP